LSNLRTSGHKLEIEAGRHKNIDRDVRYCKIYLEHNVHTIEDEFHFLMICPHYREIREHYLNDIITTSFVNEHAFHRIMSTNSDRVISKVARFIHEAYIVRENY